MNQAILEAKYHPHLPDRMMPLDAFFAPRVVAVIGASPLEGKVGQSLIANLLHDTFCGKVYAVNPQYTEVMGRPCYPAITALPERVDLAVIATPAHTVPAILTECGTAGVTSALIISAGFRECGPEGAALEVEVLARARAAGIRVIGPNCLGVINPHSGLNATFGTGMAERGTVAFLSQSGALCAAVLDWSLRAHVGFSAFVSTGSMLDVGWGELIQYFGDDPHTRSIVLYMESIGNPRAFLSAAREVALKKPIIAIKSGRTTEAAHAAMSHTGTLSGTDAVLDAAFRRCGVMRVDTIADVFYMPDVLGKQPRPQGPRLTIVTNAGGPAVLATDSLIRHGGQLSHLSDETMAALNELLPPQWSRGNPVDLLGDAGPARYARAVELVAKDPNSDGMLVILTPQHMTNPTEVARGLEAYARTGKPILASWMGGASVEQGIDLLHRAGIPTFPYPDTAAGFFTSMWQYNTNLKALYETPSLVPENGEDSGNAGVVERIIADLRAAGRTLLTETESKRLVQAYGVPVVPTHEAFTAAEAVERATEVGFPVVLKLLSHTVTHKAEVGGVQLGLADATAVERAFSQIQKATDSFRGVSVQRMLNPEIELILGSRLDPQFGPVLLFGLGGRLVKIFDDTAIGLPPLNTTLASRLIEQTRVSQALVGTAWEEPLIALLVRFSRLIVEHRDIQEIDINPLAATADGLIALDARVILHAPGKRQADLPEPVIRPYPHQYAGDFTLKDGTRVQIRPIRPEDEPLMVPFHESLSELSVYMRYFGTLSLSQRVAHERLTRVCFIDYDREMALVAEQAGKIVGVGRIIKDHTGSEAEFALVVSDHLHGKGLGGELLRRLVAIARKEKITRLFGWVLPENYAIQKLCKAAGFTVHYNHDEGTTEAFLLL